MPSRLRKPSSLAALLFLPLFINSCSSFVPVASPKVDFGADKQAAEIQRLRDCAAIPMPGIKKSQSMADALLVEGRDGAVVSQKNRCLNDGANHIATIQGDYGK